MFFFLVSAEMCISWMVYWLPVFRWPVCVCVCGRILIYLKSDVGSTENSGGCEKILKFSPL
jgi:hypothetical protein